jgi:type II secretory pathway pseudopilin PulG
MNQTRVGSETFPVARPDGASSGHTVRCRQGFGRTLRSGRILRGGFTLVELLVVIGIIIILIGITLPIMHKVRIAGYKAATSNELAQISNACTQYEQTFHAYPGPLSNDEIEGAAKSNPTPVLLPFDFYNPALSPSPYVTPAAPNLPNWNVTGSENLVLGLMGGLRIGNNSPTLPPIRAFAPSEVGLGPLSLNSANPVRASSFMPTGAKYLLWCEQQPSASTVQNQNYDPSSTCVQFSDGASTAKDSPIPEFVDQFPTQLPILYLRARTSAKGIVSDGIPANQSTADPVLGIAGQYQYDIRDITAYTRSTIGLPPGGQKGHNLQGVSRFLVTKNMPQPLSIAYTDTMSSPPLPANNAGPYFNDPTATPSDVSSDGMANYTGRPHAVDQFILIAAGADGIYGTPDDIVSFGDVSP